VSILDLVKKRVRILAALSERMCLSQCAQGDSGKRLKYHLLGGGGGGAASNAAQPPANGPPVRLTHMSHSSRARHPGFRALGIAPLRTGMRHWQHVHV
jgi:hypothetical protein